MLSGGRRLSPEEIVRVFNQWEQAATRSPNPSVALNAPLAPPTMVEAASLLPRLSKWRAQLERAGKDFHGRPVGDDLSLATMGSLWEELRDRKLRARNGYRRVWGYSRFPQPN